jgi:hypothetical protein
VPDLAGLFPVGASVDKGINLRVLPRLRCGQQGGLEPGCVIAGQVPDRVAANHHGHREGGKLVAWFRDQRGLVEEVDTV